MKAMFVLGALSLIVLTGCQTKEDEGFAVFKQGYEQLAKMDASVNCAQLAESKGWIKASQHDREAHSVEQYDIDLHDYMHLTGKDFSQFAQCQTEIEQARKKKCAKAQALIDETAQENKVRKAQGEQWMRGLSLSASTQHFCAGELVH